MFGCTPGKKKGWKSRGEHYSQSLLFGRANERSTRSDCKGMHFKGAPDKEDFVGSIYKTARGVGPQQRGAAQLLLGPLFNWGTI